VPPPLWSTSISEKGRTLGKTYWIKARCYWEHPWGTHWEPGEHIVNLMGKPLGTRREHVGNEGKNGKKKIRNPKALGERKFVVYVEPCTHEFAS